MPTELLILLLAWAAIFSLIIIVPWAVIRLTVGVLETDSRTSGADHEQAQPHYSSEETTVTELSHESDNAGDSDEAVPPTSFVNEEADR